MNYLSLFSGAGGGDLAMQHLLGFECKGYVEYEKYCQKEIRQRIEDGVLCAGPIFGDIKEFISQGFAECYKEIDLITAGFPCPDFSVAGKREGGIGENNRWPETIECIRIIRPKIAFLENVPGLLSARDGRGGRYYGRILGDLAEAGYNAKWCVLGASDCGANHRRKRLWIIAYPQDFTGFQAFGGIFPFGKERRTRQVFIDRTWPKESTVSWVLSESDILREIDGVPFRVDRLKALGNGQVPKVVRIVWELFGNC